MNDEMNVIIKVEEKEKRDKMKMKRDVEEVKKIMIKDDGEDEIKKRKMMEMDIINGN
jgi:hypothetical protein